MSLDALGQLPLSPASQARLAAACAACRGSAAWVARKQVEGRELLALAELAPQGRMIVQQLELADDIRCVYSLRVPAAWRDPRTNSVSISDFAMLGLIY